jgi:hypothetical protein
MQSSKCKIQNTSCCLQQDERRRGIQRIAPGTPHLHFAF